MEAQATTKRDRGAAAKDGKEGKEGKGPLGRARAAIAESPWGALVGKGVLAAVGFVLLALVGSGRIGGGTARIGIAEAAAATASASAPAIQAAPEASWSTSSSTGTGGGEVGDAGAPAEPGDAGAAVTAEGKVAINRATEQDLRRLPGIGATRARAILALRERLGRFRRAEDLLRVKGIGRRALVRLRPLLILDP